MERIEFGSLKIGDIAKKNLQDCLDNNWISMGEKVKQLEKNFAALMGTKYAVALSSGTSAIIAMTMALPEIRKKKGNKVIVPALGFIATSNGVKAGLHEPYWVDIEPHTLNLDTKKVAEAAKEEGIVAIYAVGTMGRPCEMEELKDIADKNDLILFEDGCENYGSKYKGKFSHSYAIGGCSSMFQAHLVQAGEGSLLYTDDEKLYDLIRSIRSHGRDPNSAYFNHLRFGLNFKMTDLQASIALEGVAQFHENIAERKAIWRNLVEFTEPYQKDAWFSSQDNNMDVMPHGFSITIKPRLTPKSIDNLKKTFDKYNIHWKRNFGLIPKHGAFFDEYVKHKEYPNYPKALWCGDNGIHIGTHRYMTEENVDRIKLALREFFQ
jgi:dTDP-4-amino-4,6-dideoxygalactose transaminase